MRGEGKTACFRPAAPARSVLPSAATTRDKRMTPKRPRREGRRIPGWYVLARSAAMLAAVCATAPAAADDGSHATVFMYHRFGESATPSTNTRIEQLEEHIRELRTGGYTVLPLPEIVEAIVARRPLPDRTVGISIDDAYLSAYREAIPRFRAAGFPVTLFVATDPVDRNFRGFMSWDQIRELARNGVTIGSQTATHPHMPDISTQEARDEIDRSQARFREELGAPVALFAYPFGEASRAVRDMVAAEFKAAFGQHSGVASGFEDLYYLPRFALNEQYGGLDRFRTAARALPLPVEDVTPVDMALGKSQNPPPLGFTVLGEPANLKSLSCYSGAQGRLGHTALAGGRVEVRYERPLRAGRERINCTMPGPDGRWRWFGRQFYVLKSG